jgi:hypothetical protein
MFFTDSISSESLDAMTPTQEHRRQVQNMVCPELGAFIPEASSSWLDSVYRDIPITSTLKRYLEGGREFRNCRWTRISNTSSSLELHGPICHIINSIIQDIGQPEKSNTRTAVIGQFKLETVGRPEKPMIAIKASGPSFSSPKGSSLGFSNIASFFDASLDSEADPWTHLARMSERIK